EGLCAGPAEVAGAVGEGFLVDGVHERGRGTDRTALGEDVDLPEALQRVDRGDDHEEEQLGSEQWDGDLPRRPEAGGAVDACGLVELAWDRPDPGGQDEYPITQVHPHGGDADGPQRHFL